MHNHTQQHNIFIFLPASYNNILINPVVSRESAVHSRARTYSWLSVYLLSICVWMSQPSFLLKNGCWWPSLMNINDWVAHDLLAHLRQGILWFTPNVNVCPNDCCIMDLISSDCRWWVLFVLAGLCCYRAKDTTLIDIPPTTLEYGWLTEFQFYWISFYLRKDKVIIWFESCKWWLRVLLVVVTWENR